MKKTTCWLPMPPNIANPKGRMTGWQAKWAAKKAYTENGIRRLRAELGTLPIFFKANYAVHFTLAADHDMDNLVHLLKWPVDAIVASGMVRDDRDAYLKLTALPTKTILPRVRRRKTESEGQFRRRQWKRDGQLRVTFTIWERPTDG